MGDGNRKPSYVPREESAAANFMSIIRRKIVKRFVFWSFYATVGAVLGAIAAFVPLIEDPAHAQSGLRQVPLGFCSLASMSASTALSACSGGVPTGTTYAVLCAYTQGVTWRDDGTAPTATAGSGGQGIAAGQCIPYNGDFTKIRFIQQTGGAILGASFYK